MSESAIRAQIDAILSGVTNIGKVYDYERWASDWSTFIGFFKTTISDVDQIRGWEIGRRSYAEKKVVIGVGSSSHEGTHVFIIRGYLGVNDASATEKTFNALIEAVAAAFRTNKTLNGTAKDHDYIQAEVIDARMFGGVLCHYSELSLTVYERI
jgi:hypothetical protein